MPKPAPGSPWLVERSRSYLSKFSVRNEESEAWPVAPNSMFTIIAKFIIAKGKIMRVGFLPCLINKQGQPEISNMMSADNRYSITWIKSQKPCGCRHNMNGTVMK